MNANDPKTFELDNRVQLEAERAERAGLPSGNDPMVDRYRLIVRALSQPLAPQLSADFDARVAQLAMRQDGDGVEDVMVSVLLAAMAMGALFFVGPYFGTILRTVGEMPLPSLPWHQVVMAAICIGVVWAVERGWMRLHSPSARHV